MGSFSCHLLDSFGKGQGPSGGSTEEAGLEGVACDRAHLCLSLVAGALPPACPHQESLGQSKGLLASWLGLDTPTGSLQAFALTLCALGAACRWCGSGVPQLEVCAP